MATQTDRFYDHFVWQASAFLEGQAAIRYPVESSASGIGNWFFQDVLPVASTDDVTRGLIPFPPLPALILVPFVAAWGLSTDDQTLFTALAAIDVVICWWMLGAPSSPAGRAPGHGRVLRLRDRVLVHRPARDDLVPGPHRRGRPDHARGRPGARRRSDRPERRA